MEQNTKDYKKIIVPIILNYLPNANIILYGSRARNDAHEGSDIDIALDIGTKIPALKISNILEDLEESDLPIKFDIVDFYALSKSMQQEILKDGVLWNK